ncbi:uncharacterized protein LOC124445038 [Xenia sp. Carnegie-2017]|uniref:uncharacterized protein LOC124445038 n=1 Tax=Xenia sp. Carnegie-2017 TaxID=2897299 RepID=UPI001F03A81C|nr:uncharacterized protein LOC124445038 [Xenia sp. Carnegie-2017]
MSDSHATSWENLESCNCLIIPQSKTFKDQDGIIQHIKCLEPEKWKNTIENSGHNIILVNGDFKESFNTFFLDIFVLCNLQSFTERSGPCDCHENFISLRNTLNLKTNDKWVCLWICEGVSYVLESDEKRIVPTEDFHKIKDEVRKLKKINDDLPKLINSRICLDETDLSSSQPLMSQHNFQKELNEMMYQKKIIYKAFYTMFHRLLCTLKDTGGLSSVKNKSNPDINNGAGADKSLPLRTFFQYSVTRLTQSDWTNLRQFVERDVPARVIRVIPNGIEFFLELVRRDMIHNENTDYMRNAFFEIQRIDLVHMLDCIKEGDMSIFITADPNAQSRSFNEEVRHQESLPPQTLLVNREQSNERNDSHVISQSSNRNHGNDVSGVDVVDGGSLPVTSVLTMTSDATVDRRLKRTYRTNAQNTSTYSSFSMQEQDNEEDSVVHSASSVQANTEAFDWMGRNRPANIADTERLNAIEGKFDASFNGSETANGRSSYQNTPLSIAAFPGTNSQDTTTPVTLTLGTMTPVNNTISTITSGTSTLGTMTPGTNALGTNTPGTITPVTNALGTMTIGNSSATSTENNSESWIEGRNYPCEHYNRYCTVKFSCCSSFWPCHRCHNAQTTCAQRKLKSRDIRQIKCRRCGLVQDFPKESPHCVGCNLKFAEYFCAICQHLTDKRNHPFHCDKCGICRVHGDRSFHCDVCGVCLDIQLRGNHKCREGSAHDVCCVCFEDAFTGCKILPCGHKVHKECAKQITKNGKTVCPKCKKDKDGRKNGN